ncbi:MAG: leucine-rich repeat domain-containing protein [Bacteroidaceae bacterium]|nr:leucine-rich repeat domain-containing protein [Bacteroidaceae bacterium]
MKKRLLLLSFVLTVIMAGAQTTEYSRDLLFAPCDGGLKVVPQITKQISDEETLTVIGDYQGVIVIPDSVEGVSVVAIDDFAFKNCKELTEITIPASVTLSGRQAFYGCSSLKKLTLEDSDEEIIFVHDEDDIQTARYWEFAALEEVYVGRNFRHVNKDGEPSIPFAEPFSHHSSLKSVVFGDKVTRINDGAFGWINTLQTVSFGAGLVTIENNAFQGSESLSGSLHFPSSLKFIGEYAFFGTSVPEVIIPNSVEEICDYALTISTLKKVVIEDGEWPIKLGAGNMDGVAPGPFGTAMFSSGGGQPLEEAYIGRPVDSHWPDLFHGNASIRKVTLGNNATGLSNSYFEGCANLETVILGDNIDRIGDLAFFGCKKLKNVNLPEGITHIGNSAFTGCQSLTDITLPSTLRYIGDYSLTGMGLTKIIIPNSVEEIGQYGVSNEILQEIVIEDSPYPLTMNYENGAVFSKCSKLEKAYVGRDIDADIFHGNQSLKEITFGNDVTTVHASFCEGCPLEKLVLGESVTTIAGSAFSFSNPSEVIARLSSIYCYALTPPVCAGDNVFDDTDKSTCKLYVPEESLDGYKAANVWKDFLNIESRIGAIHDNPSVSGRYTPDGRRTDAGQPGISILRMSDGTTRKVLER